MKKSGLEALAAHYAAQMTLPPSALPASAPLTAFLPKQEARPFPPEVLARAKRLHLAQLTIAEVRAAGWELTPGLVGVEYRGGMLAYAVSSAVQKAVKVLRDEIREVLLTEGRA